VSVDKYDETDNEEKTKKGGVQLKESSKKFTKEGMTKPSGKDDDEEEEIELDEGDVLEIAELSFEKIAMELAKQKKTVREHFKEHIIEHDFEGESIELLAPMGFIEGLAVLECDDMTELEAKCLLHVLAKQALDNAILVHELVAIMENFGIYESDKRRT
jgi:hypothetical protein